MKVAVEYISWLHEERRKINSVPLREIEFYEKGMLIEQDIEKIKEFEFTGISNMDYILTGFYNYKE